jgi:hypothetical protein
VRVLIVVVTLLAAARLVSAGDRPPVEVIVPLPPYDTQELHYPARRDPVPGTVTINRAPYRCDPDGKRFNDRAALVAHVRTVHGTPPEDIARHLHVRDGIVHYIEEPSASQR